MADNLDIIAIGECMVELFTDESLTYAKTLNKHFGGDSINTAVAAARLGSKVGYITKVGTDSFKDFFLDVWQSENIDVSYAKLVEGANGVYFVSRQKSGEKEFAYYRKKTACTTLSVNDIPEEYIERASIIYSTGITQSLSNSAREAVKKAFELGKEKGCTIAYDPNYRSRLWSVDEAKEALEEVIDYIDIIFLSLRHDVEKLFGISSPEQIIKYFWDRGVSTVVVKMGRNGSTIGYNGDIKKIDAHDIKLVDATGAGDAFNGGFLHGTASGYTPFEAAKLASVVSGKQIQGHGSIYSMPYRDEVYAEFKRGEY